MTLLAAIRDFYEDQEYKENSKATLTFYRQHFDHFLKDTGIVELSEFSEATIRRWLIGHKELSRTTLATYDCALRVFANWLYGRGYLEQHPMVNLPKPKNGDRSIYRIRSEGDVRCYQDSALERQNLGKDNSFASQRTGRRDSHILMYRPYSSYKATLPGLFSP